MKGQGSAKERAAILIEALPYIRAFFGKTIVIKYGGHAMVDPALKEAFAQDVVLMKYVGINPIIVHGGGPQISRVMERMGIRPVFVEGQRVTDEETMSVVEMVLVGTVNKDIVGLINRHGGRAVGLSGRDGDLIQAEKMKIYRYSGQDRPPEIIDIGRVGKVSRVNPQVLQSLEEGGFIPVIAPVGVGPEGVAYNINADLVAGAVAGELLAEKVIYLTDVAGVCDETGRLIPSLSLQEVEDLLQAGVAKGGMIPKLKSARKALTRGVKKAHIIDGRVPHALILEIFTDQGVGTEIIP
ncbi:acetylglutamate kinase [Thermosulfuriphilus ammonigenes]|uniref:Acetylglutamate kinase n=1 Tax=Thermosulfuriphilus ammonigenes TaxID=1936021 RepID=A0A6G7PXM4_9BACT|nr:acetylglutamate kinase [Thermosulfuriphilus ammonigenes]MBA2849557.1 acetylglutamate kinase [Thermosulfuriphilus ammonigenes]QIJ72337.1 acetylglutamate kinase [Thermosulfuriphilus ammonigenes]HFB83248.1 acetylglutamate kinase [Thermodesulfatator sp.]